MDNPFSDKKEGVEEEKIFYPGRLVELKHNDSILYFHSDNDVILKLEIISDDIIRFRYACYGYFQKDFSYAIADYAFPKANIKVKENKKQVSIKTKSLEIFISKRNLKTIIKNTSGEIICQDELGFHWERNEEYGGEHIKMAKQAGWDEVYYGLGDKPTELNLKNKSFQNWGTDTYGYKENADPIYRNIPFYYALENGNAYGIFLDNSFKTFFDFGKTRKSVVEFSADGGEMNYYFINGPELMQVCQRYTKMTGTPEMPPLWSLGYQQCKWSYHPESQVREICDTMREHRIPCDAIYLDIDYMDGYRCFTWDKEKFPQPKKMIAELKEQGFKTVVIIDPGIKIDKHYDIFQDGMEKDVFCKRQDGTYVMGKVWPGECYFPDFTNPEVREWWSGLYDELIGEIGVAGVWNDMNEPAIFEVESKTFPLDVRHDYDGHPCSHRKAHNVYGMQMARATFDGVKKVAPEKRNLIITRSGYSGLQRYSSVWTGDNIASWRHLWLANVQCQRLAISGVSFCGSDVGGFVEHPTPELFYRWVQMAVFHPFFRTHSSGDHGEQEPWSFGEEALDLVREAIELRYQLLPNIYTAFYQYHKDAIPMLRPLSFIAQDDEATLEKSDETFLGDHLLFCPVVVEECTEREVYLPEGNWIDFYTNKKYTGQQSITYSVAKNNIPLFARAGSVVPLFPVMQYVGEHKIDIVTLNVYFGKDKTISQFYHDAGEGHDYQNGAFRLAEFTSSIQGSQFVLQQKIEGIYQAEFTQYKIRLIGFSEVIKVVVDGVKMEYVDGLVLDAGFKVLEIK